MSASVLQIDVSYQPLHLVSVFDALSLVYLEMAEIIESDPHRIWSGPSHSYPHPHVIRLNHYVADYVRLRERVAKHVSGRVLLARDSWQCQYCLTPLTVQTMTIDHVKPRAAFLREGRMRSDAHTWDNVVAACKRCNGRKGDRLPVECGMYPKKTPRVPDWVQTRWAGKLHLPVQAKYVAQYYRVDPETLLGHEIKT